MLQKLLFFLSLAGFAAAAPNPHELFLKAWEAWLKDSLPEAEENARAAMRLDPKMAEARYLLARILFRKGENDAAINAFRSGQELRRDNQERLRNLVSASPIDRSSSSGSAVFEAMLNLDEAKKQYYRGKTALKQGFWQEAAESFFLAARLDPARMEYKEALMRVYLDMSDMTAAEDKAWDILEENPLQKEIYVLFVDRYGELGKPESALKWVEEGLKVYPADSYLRDRRLYFDWEARRLRRTHSHE